jgi:hypothetical protein
LLKAAMTVLLLLHLLLLLLLAAQAQMAPTLTHQLCRWSLINDYVNATLFSLLIVAAAAYLSV